MKKRSMGIKESWEWEAAGTEDVEQRRDKAETCTFGHVLCGCGRCHCEHCNHVCHLEMGYKPTKDRRS